MGFGQTEIDSGFASILTTFTPISTLLVGIFFFNLFFYKKTSDWLSYWIGWRFFIII